jgi:rhodanese-related sulfurtransferase
MLKRQQNLSFPTLFLLLSLPGLAFSAGNPGYTRVNTAQFRQMMKHKDFTLIDVHVPYQGEIPGTDKLIPYDRIADFANRLPKDKNAPVVVYCMGNEMGEIAAQTLVRMGYTHVTQYDEGMIGWTQGGGQLLYHPR